ARDDDADDVVSLRVEHGTTGHAGAARDVQGDNHAPVTKHLRLRCDAPPGADVLEVSGVALSTHFEPKVQGAARQQRAADCGDPRVGQRNGELRVTPQQLRWGLAPLVVNNDQLRPRRRDVRCREEAPAPEVHGAAVTMVVDVDAHSRASTLRRGRGARHKDKATEDGGQGKEDREGETINDVHYATFLLARTAFISSR